MAKKDPPTAEDKQFQAHIKDTATAEERAQRRDRRNIPYYEIARAERNLRNMLLHAFEYSRDTKPDMVQRALDQNNGKLIINLDSFEEDNGLFEGANWLTKHILNPAIKRVFPPQKIEGLTPDFVKESKAFQNFETKLGSEVQINDVEVVPAQNPIGYKNPLIIMTAVSAMVSIINAANGEHRAAILGGLLPLASFVWALTYKQDKSHKLILDLENVAPAPAGAGQ